MTKHTHQAVVAALVLAVAVLAFRSHASRHQVLAPTTVATIDLELVFEGLTARQLANDALQQLASQLETENAELSDAISQLNEELEAYPPGSDKHRRTLEQLQLATLDYQAHAEFARHKIDLEKSMNLRRIYDRIKQVGEQMAIELGYDMVLVDDSVAVIPPGTETEVQRQISARRMIFTSPVIDVTDELIRRMNQ